MTSISEVFQNLKLPALEALDLSGMLGSAPGISAFLRDQPRLRKLSLQEIEPSEGTWADLVDDMLQWLLLDFVKLQLPLREDGGVEIWDDKSWCCSEISEKNREISSQWRGESASSGTMINEYSPYHSPLVDHRT